MRSLYLAVLLVLAVSTPMMVTADEIVDEATAVQKIKELGGTFHDATPVTARVSREPIPTLVIPYWKIAIPLTFLSAYLLLSNPRSVAPQRAAE